MARKYEFFDEFVKNCYDDRTIAYFLKDFLTI